MNPSERLSYIIWNAYSFIIHIFPMIKNINQCCTSEFPMGIITKHAIYFISDFLPKSVFF